MGDGKWENPLYRLDCQKSKEQKSKKATNKEQKPKAEQQTTKIKKTVLSRSFPNVFLSLPL